MAQDCGVSAVTLHGRTRQEMYAGKANWDAIGELAAALSVPVIGNGDIDTVEDAQSMLRQTGCHAVMVGRGAMGNPWIFRDWQRMQQGLEPLNVTHEERIATALSHARQLIAHKGDYIGIREMRKHISWYTKGMPNSARLRNEINSIEDFVQLESCVEKLFEL